MLKSPASLLQTHKTLEIQCQVKRHSSRTQSGKTAFSAELVKRYSVESRRLSTVISGALPSPNATGVYRHTIIIIRIVSSAHARKDQLANSARLQLPTHPRELYSTTCQTTQSVLTLNKSTNFREPKKIKLSIPEILPKPSKSENISYGPHTPPGAS